MDNKRKKNQHYVNNRDFSNAVVEYVVECERARKERRNSLPIVPDYVADCFLKIAEGLSRKSNFIGYSYREEMVMDAVENCLKAVGNYDISKTTRTGKPNAFSYFTQITWFAFLRRIAKENKQRDIKERYKIQAGIEQFVVENEAAGNDGSGGEARYFVDVLKNRIDAVKERDGMFQELRDSETDGKKRRRRRRAVKADSDLSGFIS